MKTDRRNLTDTTIESLRPRPKSWIVWDKSLPGFGARVAPSGRVSFIVQGRVRGSRKGVREVVGRWPVASTAAARGRALDALGAMWAGIDPKTERHAREAATAAQEPLSAYWPVYLDHSRARLKPATLRMYSSQWRLRVAPRFGAVAITEITHGDIVAWSAGVRRDHGDSIGNRSLATISAVLADAKSEQRIERNPARGVPRVRLKPRKVNPTKAKRVAIGRGIESIRESHPRHFALFAVLAATGFRLREVLHLSWSDIGYRAASEGEPERWFLTLRNIKSGGDRTAPVARSVVELLRTVPRTSDRVFTPPPGAQEMAFRAQWEEVRTVAGLPGFRCHDLRHAWASKAINSGVTLPVIAASLGQKTMAVAAMYAEVLAATKAQTHETVAAGLLADMGLDGTGISTPEEVAPS